MKLNNNTLKSRDNLLFWECEILSTQKKWTSAIIQKAINMEEISKEQILEMKEYWFVEKEIISMFNDRALDLLENTTL